MKETPEPAQMHEARKALEDDYKHSWSLFSTEAIPEAKLKDVVDTDMDKLKECIATGLDIGGIIKRCVNVDLYKNSANGVSLVWITKEKQHWYPILQYKSLWSN